jgi:uncharacterized protein
MQQPRYAFFYLMCDDFERILAAVPAHIRYWHEQGPGGVLGGPFADQSGGLIIFAADDLPGATRIAECDPFVTSGVLAQHWIKPWLPDRSPSRGLRTGSAACGDPKFGQAACNRS